MPRSTRIKKKKKGKETIAYGSFIVDFYREEANEPGASERGREREAKDSALFLHSGGGDAVIGPTGSPRWSVRVLRRRWWRDPECIESRIFADFRRASFTHEWAPAGSPGRSAPSAPSVLRGSLDRGRPAASGRRDASSTRCLRAFENAHENALAFLHENARPSACFGTHTQHLRRQQRARGTWSLSCPDPSIPADIPIYGEIRLSPLELARSVDHERARNEGLS